jgi:hypothetical protein
MRRLSMPLYEVALSCSFILKVNAQTEKEAVQLSQFFLGFHDSSDAFEREEFKFEFRKIDVIENELISVERAEN